MKKKNNAKDRRKQADFRKKEIISTVNEEKKQREEAAAEEERQAQMLKEKAEKERQLEKIERQDEKSAQKAKSGAKAAGLKSAFVLDADKVLMTSFGKGNSAVLDKYISGGEVSDASEDAQLSVDAGEREFGIHGRIIEHAKSDNPLHSRKTPGDDVIHCRRKLERMYFGHEFEDNVHIQLIYSILDIEKILAAHVNNVVYQLNNILRHDEDERSDLFLKLGFSLGYDELCRSKSDYDAFSRLIRQPQLGYFGADFVPYDSNGRRLSGSEWKAFEKKCHALMTLIGEMRQATAHGDENTRARMYQLRKDGEYKSEKEKTVADECRKVLDRMFSEKVDALNRNFLDTSGKDIYILLKTFNLKSAEEQNELIRSYYDFVVRKSYRNKGFSIKRLRETMIDEHAPGIREKKYDTVRSKLNRAIDFAINRFYEDEAGSERAAAIVERLRACTKESEKILCYRHEAMYLWKQLEPVINDGILPKMNGEYIKRIKKQDYGNCLAAEAMISGDMDSFSKLVYLLTVFLDGKEINDLLTQLTNRFENIAGFIEVMEKAGISEYPLKNRYQIFEKSKEIAGELRIINSFARMSSADELTEKIPYLKSASVMYKEAAEILGYSGSEDELDSFISGMLDKESEYQKKHGKGFRNFIANNVIESSRFRYLVRYGNPKKVKAIAENRAVVLFALDGIPDEQICRYYNSCNGESRRFFPEMREDLADKICDLKFLDFENVKQGNDGSIAEAEDKERKKNIVRLYLTVLYHVLKNLVYVNSRYYLAFHCVERDAMVYDPDRYDAKVLKDDWSAFAREFVDEYPRKHRVQNYLKDNFANSDRWAIRTFRNCVAHLNPVRNADAHIRDVRNIDSYFELYHYLLQCRIMDRYEFEKKEYGTEIGNKTEEYFNMVDRYKSYCKDFVKALNVPFAYNLARFKNLSINELFDRNNYLPNRKL